MEAPYNKNRNPKGSHSKINSRNNSNFAAVYRQEENISEKDHFFLFGNHYGSFACGMQRNENQENQSSEALESSSAVLEQETIDSSSSEMKCVWF